MPNLLFAFAIAVLLLLAGSYVWLDTASGHRFIAARIEGLEPSSGLRFKVGRIDGSIYRNAVIHDLRISDPKGVVLTAPVVRLDWYPLGWLSNRLDIDRLLVPRARLHKLPQTIPSKEPKPILPGFDIRLADLRIGRLQVDKAVAGRAQVLQARGKADVRSGRAMVDLDAAAIGPGDRLSVLLDAEPDRDRFDIDAQIASPEGGLFGALAGIAQPFDLTVNGKGSWKQWNGTLKANVAAAPLADLALSARSGVYGVRGDLFPQRVKGGLIARLSGDRLRIDGQGTLAHRLANLDLTLHSRALALTAKGGVDLAHGGFDDLRIDTRLLTPQLLVKGMSGQDIRARLRLDGAFSTARFEYLLTATRLALDKTIFVDVRGTGKGRLAAEGAPVLVPVSIGAREVIGAGPLVGGILRRLTIEGVLQLKDQVLSGPPLRVRANKLDAKALLMVNLRTGRYDVALSGAIQSLLIPGFGVVDIRSAINALPRAGGRGLDLSGRVEARVRRLDNGFLSGLAGGLPVATSRISRGTDGLIHLTGLHIVAPLIDLRADGYRRRDGSFHFNGVGEHQTYGPLALTLDGKIDRPQVRVHLVHPFDAAQLADVDAELVPTAEGYDVEAQGGSVLGPFTAGGAILLPKGEDAQIRIDRLDVSEMRGTGTLTIVEGGRFLGRIGVTGGGMEGAIDFQPVGGIQQIAAKLTARNAQFAAAAPMRIRRGELDATILLDPAGTTVNATTSGSGLVVGSVRLGRFTGEAKLRSGAGTISAALAGARGRDFDLKANADVRPARIVVGIEGSYDRRPVRLSRSAIFTQGDGGWSLAPVTLRYGGGQTQISGRFDNGQTALSARMNRMPLILLDVINDRIGLGGTASGTLSYRQSAGEAPTGEADLRIRGLTRSGLVLSSEPVDVGVNAVLNLRGAAARAVIESENKVIGRAQARIAPLGPGTGLDRLSRAPLFAQLRYSGPAGTLWRLTNIETFDLAGPAAIGADVSGTLANPQIRGSFETRQARITSPVTGMALTGITARGGFDGSVLRIDGFTGTTEDKGQVSGTATFDLSAAHGFGINIDANAKRALLVDRDDLTATVSGPIHIRSDGSGGTISGDVVLDHSSYRLGRATAATQIPALKVREFNRRGEELEEDAPASPWTLDMHARARRQLIVTGLGLDSEWSADLQISGAVTQPIIKGEANLIRGGYEFSGRRFELDRGSIRFVGNNPPDPTLDIAASADIQDLSATINVGGTGLHPEITFSSTPAMPEDELLSRLLFGTSITNLSAPEALQLAAAVASLQDGGTGLNPINAVRQAAGLDRLRILPADPTTGQGTSIAAGKYIGRRTYVELITDGQGYSATQAEFQITRWLSILSSISTLGRQSINVRVSKDY